jgi:hypothetical protein
LLYFVTSCRCLCAFLRATSVRKAQKKFAETRLRIGIQMQFSTFPTPKGPPRKINKMEKVLKIFKNFIFVKIMIFL